MLYLLADAAAQTFFRRAARPDSMNAAQLKIARAVRCAHLRFFYRPLVSLTPCFSWVEIGFARLGTVSTVSTVCGKPLKRFFRWRSSHTQLKQGVNENRTAKAGKLCKIQVRSQSVPKGRLTPRYDSVIPWGLKLFRQPFPTLKRWAIVASPFGRKTAPLIKNL